MTIPILHSRATKDPRKAQIEAAQSMIWQARFIGWPALEASWRETLRKLLEQQ